MVRDVWKCSWTAAIGKREVGNRKEKRHEGEKDARERKQEKHPTGVRAN